MARILQLFFVLSFLVPVSLVAQVTSSSLRGHISDSKGEDLIGASVVAVHLPSGTQYGTVTDASGNYILPGVRVGGPYKVTVSYIGYQDRQVEDVFAYLGVVTDVNAKLDDASVNVDEVLVVASRGDLFSSDRNGAAVTFNNQSIQSIPTLGRTVNDII